MSDLTAEFFAGFESHQDCFSPGNPHLPTSPCHMAFEAGRRASFDYLPYQIKSAKLSRGFSIRLKMRSGPDTIYRIDYDRKQVTRHTI